MHKKVSGKINIFHGNLSEKRIVVLPHGHCGDIMTIIQYVKGFIFEASAAAFDHYGIIAREMDIPCIYGVKDALQLLHQDDEVVLDGYSGEIIVLNRKYVD